MAASPPLEVDITVSEGAPPLDLDRLAALLQFAAAEEGTRGVVGVWICSDAEIADLHRRFMGIEGPTDVMSFPGEGDDYLGDIAVSYETAAIQAVEAAHGTAREIAYLALHGLLHLIGYDDLDPNSRAAMLARQDALIAAFERAAPGEWS